MSAQKDINTGKWYIQYRYTDWTGKRKHSVKRGFNTKREAEDWLISFQHKKGSKLNISFGEFTEMYFEDMSARLRKSTLLGKRYLFDSKILPYFKDKQLDEITVSDIRKWQNHLIKTEKSATYIKTINNQMAALFNYAVRYYDLGSNPCAKAGTIGKSNADEMNIWTLEEFTKFLDAIIDKPQSYLAFMLLFWTGMRVGELLALTPADIDCENRVIRITKSYQRLRKEDLITEPKTECSRRKITIPEFIIPYIQDYESRIYGLKKNDRLFPFTKDFLEHEMKRGVKTSNVKKIRIHDLRHSHASRLISMGFGVKEIQNRLGHQKSCTTLDTYSHLYPDSQDKLASRLNSIYKGGSDEKEEE